MNSVQREYAKAKATYLVIRDSYSNEMDKFEHLLESGKFEEHDKIDEEVDIRLGRTESRNALVVAENALIDWSQEKMKKEFPANVAALAPAYNAARQHHYKFRDKVVALAFRLKE
jgi:hypothetical protein